MKSHVSIAVVALCLGSASRSDGAATNVRPVAPYDDALQTYFDHSRTVVGGPGIDAIDDQSPAALFSPAASGRFRVTFLRNPRYFMYDEFGIYDASNPANKVVLFEELQGWSARADVEILLDGTVVVDDTSVATFDDPTFGFYIDVFQADDYLDHTGLDDTFSSEDDLNLNQEVHALAFQGDNQTTLCVDCGIRGGSRHVFFSEETFILAFEDLRITDIPPDRKFQESDRNYTDMIVLVESVRAIPEPASLSLLALAILIAPRYRKSPAATVRTMLTR